MKRFSILSIGTKKNVGNQCVRIYTNKTRRTDHKMSGLGTNKYSCSEIQTLNKLIINLTLIFGKDRISCWFNSIIFLCTSCSLDSQLKVIVIPIQSVFTRRRKRVLRQHFEKSIRPAFLFNINF